MCASLVSGWSHWRTNESHRVSLVSEKVSVWIFGSIYWVLVTRGLPLEIQHKMP